MVLQTAEDEAIRITCSNHLHQSFWLPATGHHSKLKVTYSTTTNFGSTHLPIILFVGPMFGTRWIALDVDKLARDCGVRVICVDRPSFGGSTPVPIDIRITVWLETVPALLGRLNVKHVALVTHSAGTIYTLNTLYHLRSYLYAHAPYVAFLAPWTPTAHSGVALLTIASKLPTNIIDHWSGLVSFIATKIVPSAAWSGGMLTSSSALLSPLGTDHAEETTSIAAAPERYGVDKETAEIIAKLAPQYQWAENVTGGNEEAKLCLRKCDGAAWGEAHDYARCIQKIAQNEQGLGQGAAKLMVGAFFASSDIMIGKGGQKYFEECWQSEEVKGKVDFTTATFPETDHDSVLLDHKRGALRLVFQAIAQFVQIPARE